MHLEYIKKSQEECMFQQRFRLDIKADKDRSYILDCPSDASFKELLEVAKCIYKLSSDKIKEAEAKIEEQKEPCEQETKVTNDS